MSENHDLPTPRLAIVGMAARFPGSTDVEAFWSDLREGVERIKRFSAAELRAAGIPEALLRNPSYVPAKGVLAEADRFDPSPFGIGAREAELLDPQHRVFLECAMEALEDAGYAGEARADRLIGVFAGSGASQYGQASTTAARTAEDYQHRIATDKDFLAARVSHKLDLHGPSLTVQSACSTSLVAVCLASQSLLTYQCDVALAGGVSISLPLCAGYLHQPGMILSPDGHCRAFDASAAGTVPGDGVGVVVLRRLEDALADGDAVLALVGGYGIRNDGAAKQSFSAPGVEGQASAIAAALAMAGVSPEAISYIEAHGTGTPLGDPIEVAALKRAFRRDPRRRACALGSVKSNIGHLDAAAGIAGLIKVVQMFRHQAIPKSLHIERINPHLGLEESPFFVNSVLRPWEAGGRRRAGVSSFGIGGTNAHVILEEAPPAQPTTESPRPQLLTLSAATMEALATLEQRIAQYLLAHPETTLADVAFTLQVGRRAHRHRRALVYLNREDAIAGLAGSPPADAAAYVDDATPEVVFLFPGHGAGSVNMGRELYDAWPSFRDDIDQGIELLRQRAGLDLQPILLPSDQARARAEAALTHAALGQPALFLVEWAIARLLIRWGVRPRLLIGHSLGEYGAACLAGVMSLADALAIVARRGALIASTPEGAMLSVELPAEELGRYLTGGLAVAAINGPSRCVVAGAPGAVTTLERELSAAGIAVRLLRVPHAFHSPHMDGIVDTFVESVGEIKLQPPSIPIISCVTGQALTAEEAVDPRYWGDHLRQTVRFDAALRIACATSSRLLVEVGPGETLTMLARRFPGLTFRRTLSTLGRASTSPTETARLLDAVASLWEEGLALDLSGLHEGERRRRVRLPAYPFERRRYWIEPRPRAAPSAPPPSHGLPSTRDVGGWLYRPAWRPNPRVSQRPYADGAYLIFADALGLAGCMKAALCDAQVNLVFPGEAFAQTGPGVFTIRPGETRDYAELIASLTAAGELPDRILHLWGMDVDDRLATERGLLAVMRLLRALGSTEDVRPMRLQIATRDASAAGGGALERPELAMAMAFLRVVPEEYPHIVCHTVDLSSQNLAQELLDSTARALLQEVANAEGPVALAYRGENRYELAYAKEPVVGAPARTTLREGGTCLITGGLGGIGLVLARHLARSARARLVLVSRTGLPPRALWADIVADAEPALDPDSLAFRIRCVLSLEDMGAEVLILAADVACATEMKRVMAEVHARFGPLHGVIHSAGVMVGGVIQRPADEDLYAALAPKVDGTRNLASVTADEPLDFFAMCSSLTAVLGGFGQLAYAAANCFLDAFAEHLRQRGIRAVSVNWDGWAEVGAAARAAKTSAAEAVRRSVTVHPLLGMPVAKTAKLALFQSRLDPARDWILRDHRIAERPTLPGTAYIELARAAATALLGERPLALRNLVLFSPLVAKDEGAMELWTLARSAPDGITLEIYSRPATAEMPVIRHAVCSCTLIDSGVVPVISLDLLREGCERERSPRQFLDERRPLVALGEPWRCMRRLWVGFEQAAAELIAPAPAGYALDPAVLDMGAGCGLSLTSPDQLPYSYGAIRIHGPLRGRVFCRAKLIEKTLRSSRFSVALYDDEGRARVEIDDYFLMAVKPSIAGEDTP